MSWFTPFFLFGLLGIALPIWLHRLQTQTTEREMFSSAMFLEASKKRIHVQRKLKYLLLMALRIAFFILLALAFARPSFLLPPQPIASVDSTHHVIVIDTSFSMKEGNSFDEALTMATTIINDLEADDQVSIYSASSSVNTIASPDSDQAALLTALNTLEPNNGRLDIGAMVSALNNLIEASPANFVLHIVSDFQLSGQAVRFADMIPNVIDGRPVQLVFEQVKTNDVANLAVSSVSFDQGNINVGISGYLNSDSSKTLSITVNNILQQEIEITPSTTPEAYEYYLFEDLNFEPGDNRVSVQISPADSLADDDLRYSVYNNTPPAPVLLLSANPDGLATTYITAALETAPRGYEVEAVNISELDIRILQRYPWLVIDDLGAINQSLAEAITSYLNGGGSVLAALGELSQGLDEIPVSGHQVSYGINFTGRDSQSIAQINTSHSVLDRAIGWNSVNVAQTLPLVTTEEDQVLISTDDGTPLLIEQAYGQGQLLLFNTSLDNSWTDLPVKPVFVTFMAEAAQYLSRENVLIKEQVVDSFLQLAQNGGASGQVYDPDGESLLTLADTTRSQDIQLNKTGYYQVFTPQGEVLVAVNSDSRESDLKLTDIFALQNWQNSVANSAGATTEIVNGVAVSIEGEQRELEIWRVLLALLAIIVLAESLLSNRYLQYKTDS